ncbi:MAG: gamma-carboxymuconolactone decarboxylase, partial [Sodaliphilus sp.]|nr:gamma-carboxymuconolactone decarboxylase [Sodaliphilus sp.]MDY3215951.1 gamma-carboxymuconolactone decarboxylase [Sodaliphilus sp.]MDY3215960.1 gamma-carboxymuconolactone decarboxylase [Sodaliphilus sp.]
MIKHISLFIVLAAVSIQIMAQKKITQTAGRTQLGEFAPEFAHLN